MFHWSLAVLGYVATRIDGWLRAPLRRAGLHLSGTWLIAIALLMAAAVPTYFETVRVSPQGVGIDQITNRSLSALTSWVRLEGRVVTLRDDRQTTAGYAVTSVLIDDQGRGIMLSSTQPVEGRDDITGQAANSQRAGDIVKKLAPPRLLDNVDVSPSGLVLVDDVPPPGSTTPWWLIYGVLVIAGLLIVGQMVGYPVFGAARPRIPRARGLRAPNLRALSGGQTVPAGVDAELRRSGRTTALEVGAARVGPGDAYGELLLVIPEKVDAPAHEVRIRRDMWTSVRVGRLYSVRGGVPAFQVRAYALHGIVSFASVDERDRAAAVLAESGG